MTRGHVVDRAGYARLAQSLARQALAVARDAAPHRAPAGEARWPIDSALSAARVLIGDDDPLLRRGVCDAAASFLESTADPACKVTDGFGHARPVYACFASYLLGAALWLIGDSGAADRVVSRGRSLVCRDSNGSPAAPAGLQAWSALLAALSPLSDGEDGGEGAAQPELAARQPPVDQQFGLRPSLTPDLSNGERGQDNDAPTPLWPMSLDEQPDNWTYQELSGLHALYLTAQITGEGALVERAARAADYHLGHTQPDYTTYQPWALACFASRAATAVFAEQQLHDVATHLSIEGPGGAVMPALLLADAAATLDGRVVQARRGRASTEVRS